MKEKNPLAAFHRSSSQCQAVLDSHKPPSLKILHLAWNSFARLLDLGISKCFQCPSCGIYPDVIICDGTSIGFRKDLIPATWNTQEHNRLPLTNGSQHSERVFIHSTKGRELLLKYSGYTKDRKKLAHDKSLSANEMQTMMNLIEQDSKALAKLIAHLQKKRNNTIAPNPFDNLFLYCIQQTAAFLISYQAFFSVILVSEHKPYTQILSNDLHLAFFHTIFHKACGF